MASSLAWSQYKRVERNSSTLGSIFQFLVTIILMKILYFLALKLTTWFFYYFLIQYIFIYLEELNGLKSGGFKQLN